MTQLGPRLAAYVSVSNCDTKHEHEVHVVTDGHMAYSSGPITDNLLVHRERTLLTVECRQPEPHTDEPCTGSATFDLTDTLWSADAEQLANLASYGVEVDQ